jgi:hypothetical protein
MENSVDTSIITIKVDFYKLQSIIRYNGDNYMSYGDFNENEVIFSIYDYLENLADGPLHTLSDKEFPVFNGRLLISHEEQSKYDFCESLISLLKEFDNDNDLTSYDLANIKSNIKRYSYDEVSKQFYR